MATPVRDLTGAEMALFAEVVGELSRPSLDDDPRTGTARCVLDLMRSDTLASYVWDPRHRRYGDPVVVNHDPVNVERYVSELQFDDPLTERMRRLRGAQIVERAFPMRDLADTAFYAELLRPDRMFHGINVFVEAGEGRVVDLRIWRQRHRPAFDQRDVDLLDTLANVLCEAMATDCPATARLTARERDVGRLIVRGFTDKDIAAHLGISFSTVRTHVNRCFAKLGCANRAELSARLSAGVHRQN